MTIRDEIVERLLERVDSIVSTWSMRERFERVDSIVSTWSMRERFERLMVLRGDDPGMQVDPKWLQLPQSPEPRPMCGYLGCNVIHPLTQKTSGLRCRIHE